MPSSAKDRFTVDFEYLFFFVKNKKYWFEQQFEPHLSPVTNKIVGRKGTDVQQSQGDPNGYHAYGQQGRNKRTVWTIPTKPYPEAHFAVYPAELIRTCIKAGCPRYVCKKCGKAREKIYVKSKYMPKIVPDGIRFVDKSRGDKNRKLSGQEYNKFKSENPDEFKGYTDCGCNAGFEGGIVLDPFAGSGTTLEEAIRQGKDYIGIELKDDYIDLINKRLSKVQVSLI